MALFGSKKEVKVIISGETSKYERSLRNVQRVTKRMTNRVRKMWKSAAVKIASSLAFFND